MKVKVLFFASLRDRYGSQAEMEFAPGVTLAELGRRLELDASVAFGLNQVLALPNSPLAEGDEVALLPPVSGG